MKNNRDYASKTQHKFQNRLNKYVAKSRLKHNDEIIRINHDRMRKMERENQRGEVVVVKGDQRRKYIVMGVVCLVLMLVSMFAILSRKIEAETNEIL